MRRFSPILLLIRPELIKDSDLEDWKVPNAVIPGL